MTQIQKYPPSSFFSFFFFWLVALSSNIRSWGRIYSFGVCLPWQATIEGKINKSYHLRRAWDRPCALLCLILAKILCSFSYALTDEVENCAHDLTAEGGRVKI